MICLCVTGQNHGALRSQERQHASEYREPVHVDAVACELPAEATRFASREGQAGRRSIYWAAGLGRHGHMQAERRGSSRARTGDSNRRLGVHSTAMR